MTRRLLSPKQMREVYNIHRDDRSFCPGTRLMNRELRQAYLEGIIDAIRTSLNSPRSPYQPEAYGPDLRSAYELGFSCR